MGLHSFCGTIPAGDNHTLDNGGAFCMGVLSRNPF